MSADERDDGVVAGDDVSDIIEEAEPPADTDDADTADTGSVTGSIAHDVEVTPQMPTLENSVFVALGVYLVLLVFADATVGLSPALVVVTLVAVGIPAAACYGIFVWTIPDT